MEGDDTIFVPQVTIGAIPKIGQRFETLEDAFTFYNDYAQLGGFSARKANSKRNKETQEVVWKSYVCAKQGRMDETYQFMLKNAVPRTGERKRGESRCGCGAKLSVVRNQNENTWDVCNFVEVHNHALATPTKIHLLRSHRNVSTAKKALAQQFSQANIPTCQQLRIMEIDSGGPSSVGCSERDIRNHRMDLQQDSIGHDAESFVQHLALEKQRNSNFYYAYETDEDGVFTRCFWADSESRSSYVHFGDAVVFDTTYNTNKYSLIFAPFVGVNHHRQTTVFGCGLLSDEKTDSFVWLFSRFLEAMPTEQAPRVLITDQDAAISKAVGEVFPNTLHRFCLWHILNKFSEKMSALLYKEQYHNLVNIIKQSETSSEFEQRWSDVMENTDLGSNEWLRTMYEIRSSWVPTYFRHVFAAGMYSSQRSESNHAFYKRYVDRTNSLMDFVTRFSSALAHQRHEELMGNHTDLNEQPRVTTAFMMEKQMSKIYTKTIFLLFQAELEQSMHYICSKVSSSESTKVYAIERFELGKIFDRTRKLTFFTASKYMSCTCQLFEFAGYPCRHMLSFMKIKQVMLLPEVYILRRWTKNAKSNPVYDRILNSNTPGNSLVSRHGMLSQKASALVDEASLTDARTNFLMDEFSNLIKQVTSIDDGGDVGVSRNRCKSSEETTLVCDPIPVRTKGCGKRLRSSKEIAMSQSKRSYRECGHSGHDRRTCPTKQPRSNLTDEPYQPEMSWDHAQDERQTCVGSSDYHVLHEFHDVDFY